MSDTGTGAGIGAAAGGGIGDIIGWFLSQGDRDTARKLLGEATQGTEGLNPNVQTFQQGNSALGSADPRTREDQMAALDQLQNIWSNQGLDPTARAQIAQAQLSSEQQANAQNNQLEGMAAQRGMLDSGNLMAAQRSNAQAAANTGAMANMNAAAGGQQRAIQALGQYQQGAGQVRGQDYQAASAQDAINRFNTANAQAQAQQNYGNAMGKNQAIAGYGQGYGEMASDTLRKTQAAGQAAGAAVGSVAPSIASAAGM